MHFAFEGMDVYQRASDLMERADAIAGYLPRGRGYLKDQIRRASISILANIAEGVGEYRGLEKARLYRIARREAFECGSHLLSCRRLNLVPKDTVAPALVLLQRVVSMLTALIRRHGGGVA